MKKTKSNRYLNKVYENRQLRKVRPKEPDWDFFGLDQVIKQWTKL